MTPHQETVDFLRGIILREKIQLGPSTTNAQLLELIADEQVRYIELLGGTWSNLAAVRINIERDRPLLIRPALGAEVIVSGAGKTGGLFYFGYGGAAGNISLGGPGLILDGWVGLQQTGLVWIGNAHDITMSKVRVRSCGAPAGQSASAQTAYVSDDAGVGGRNIYLPDWIVTGVNRTMCGFQISGNALHERIVVPRWQVSGLGYSIYDDSSNTSDLLLDGWTGNDCGMTAGTPSTVVFTRAEGRYSNLHFTNSLGLLDYSPGMIDGGGNTWA